MGDFSLLGVLSSRSRWWCLLLGHVYTLQVLRFAIFEGIMIFLFDLHSTTREFFYVTSADQFQ